MFNWFRPQRAGRGPPPLPPPLPPSDPKERELSALPVGLVVTHSPNPVRAQRGGRSGRPLTWLYTTTVRAAAGPVVVTEFGLITWHNGQWVFEMIDGRPFTAAEFADWYGCPHAEVYPDHDYADPNNWTGGLDLHAHRTKWYFIGLDVHGRRVKGEAVVDALAELAD